MPDSDDDEERYFRPRPGTTGDDTGQDEAVDGVAVEESGAPSVTVTPGNSGPQRPGASFSRKRLLVPALISAVVLAISGSAWAFQDYVDSKVERVEIAAGKNRPKSAAKGAKNILVMGVDRREGLSRKQIRDLRLGRQAGQRSDTMMLVHMSKKRDRVQVVSLPRDSLVTIPGHKSNGSEGPVGAWIGDKQNKLNATYQFGGHNLTIQTVERATGVRVDHFVEVNFLGFLKMVDALGGVDICTETLIDDEKSGLRLEPGKHHIDAPTALAYARTRASLTGGSDLGRIDRQQQFMAAMMKQALSGSTLTDPVKSARFLNATLEALRMDKGMGKDDLQDLAKQLGRLSTDSVSFSTVPMASQGQYIPGVGAAIAWHPQAAPALFSSLKHDKAVPQQPGRPKQGKNDLTVPPKRIQVTVLNGAGTRGLGARAASDLRDAGFGIAGVPGNAKRTGATAPVIQYGPGREDSAKTLKAAMPDAQLKLVSTAAGRLRVIVGSKWQGVKKVKVDDPEENKIVSKTATQNICK